MSIPETMQALVLKEDGFSGTSEGPSISSLEPYLDYASLPVPEISNGQALVRVIMASVNPSDLHYIKGEYGVARRKGVPAGFEAVGEVVKAAKGGEGLVGKRVGFFGSISGVWAEYAVAELSACVPVMDGVKDEDAAGLLVNPLTAIAMYEEARLNTNGSQNDCFIMTAAASQLCKFIAGLAQEDGTKVISIVRREAQVETLKAYSNVTALNSSADDFQEKLADAIKSLKPRVMLDAVGNQISSDIFTQMPSHVRWVIYGKLSSDAPVVNQMGQFIFMGKRIEGFWLSQWMKEKSRDDQMAAGMKVQQMFASQKWETDIAQKISLSQAHAELPDALSSGKQGKVILLP